MLKILAILGLVLLAFPANAGAFIDGEFIFLEGEITKEDAVKITSLDNLEEITTIVLNSDGGDYTAAKDIAFWVRFHEIETVVAEGENCLSGCSLIFQAGYPHRVAGHTSHIGIHSVRTKLEDGHGGHIYLLNPALTDEIVRLYSLYGMEDACLDKVSRTDVKHWVIMSGNTLEVCNVVTEYLDPSTDMVPLNVASMAVERTKPGTKVAPVRVDP